MNRKILIIGTAVLLLFVGFSGCVDEESKFIGTWKDEVGDLIIFYSDGSMQSEESIGIVKGTWKIENEELTITTSGLVLIYSYTFSNNDRTLTLVSKVHDSIKVLKKQ